jgi:DNA-directed RNA polymerase specialized sigma subunit
MVIVESYKDLLEEIVLLDWLHEDLIRQLQRNKAEVWGHSMPLDKSVSKYDNIIERMKAIEEEIDLKKELASKIEAGIKNLKGIEYTVAFMRDIEGKTLTEIASETKFTYSYISKVSVKINSAKRMQTQA